MAENIVFCHAPALLQLTMDNKFIIKSFLDATRIVDFHEK
jgi:hypothetical protein